MSWYKFLSFSTVLMIVFGVFGVDKAITEEIDLSGNWSLTEILHGCGDNKIEVYSAEIIQKGNRVKFYIGEDNREVTGEIYNNEILCESIKAGMHTEETMSARIYENEAYTLKICEEANLLIGKRKLSINNSNFSCDGILKIIYIKN